jgi:hypothetical protein
MKSMRNRSVRLAAAAAAIVALQGLGPARAAHAASIEGVRFTERVSRDDQILRLRGTALLRYGFVFKVYAAALYLASGVPSERALEDVPRRLEIEYFRPISAEDFRRAANAVLARNVDPRTLERLRPRIERLHDLYADVEAGDRYALTYLPGRGTELAMNGEPLGTIAGADFASAYFRIWLGEEPVSESLREDLLNGR